MQIQRNEGGEYVLQIDSDTLLTIYHLASVEVDRMNMAGMNQGIIFETNAARIKKLIGTFFQSERTRRQVCVKREGFLSKLFRNG
jgi:hypothetical protein